jgi:predicted ester cyclase
MSTEENKALMRRLTEEIWNKKNLALVDELIDAKFIEHGIGGPDLKGPEEFKQFVNMVATTFPDFHMTIDDTVAEGDRVVSRMTMRGTHQGAFMGIAPTGKKVTVIGVKITRFAGGKMVESWMVNDTLGMMQQIGAVPKEF